MNGQRNPTANRTQGAPLSPPAATPESAIRAPAIHEPAARRRRSGLVVLGSVAGVATLGLVLSVLLPVAGTAGASPSAPAATVLTNCAAAPSRCGFPDVTDTGVPEGTVLRTVPGQVSSGPGWKFNSAAGTVAVTGNGAVLSGLYIPYNLDISATNVTVNNVQVMTPGNFGISLRHTAGVTIESSTISGQNSATGRVGVAISDIYGDSTGMTVEDNNISSFKTGVQVSTGLVSGNYIHDPGYIAGDHTNGIFDPGTTQPLMISGNTILINLGQTDAISLDASAAGQAVANKAVENNLITGGSYSIYGGASLNDATSNIVIEGNRFGQIYHAKSGLYGPVAYFDSHAAGDVWSGNIWDGTGQAIPAP